jgi:hypothetical protein
VGGGGARVRKPCQHQFARPPRPPAAAGVPAARTAQERRHTTCLVEPGQARSRNLKQPIPAQQPQLRAGAPPHGPANAAPLPRPHPPAPYATARGARSLLLLSGWLEKSCRRSLWDFRLSVRRVSTWCDCVRQTDGFGEVQQTVRLGVWATDIHGAAPRQSHITYHCGQAAAGRA